MNDEYYEFLKTYYNELLISKNDKFSKCDKCKNNKQFISQLTDEGIQLIYTCGNLGEKNKCGIQFTILLPNYINYDDELKILYNKINSNINFDELSKFINIDLKEYEDRQKEYLESYHKLETLFIDMNNINEKNEECERLIRKRTELYKDCEKLLYSSE